MTKAEKEALKAQQGGGEGQAAQEQASAGGFVYPEYDLWKIDIESLPMADQQSQTEKKRFKFTAVKIERPAVKIEHSVAEQLNVQSHNNMKRYYLAGTVTNGDEETVTIN